MNTIKSIHKVGDPMDPESYRTIMIGHVMAKFYASVLDGEVSASAEVWGLKAARQANHSILEHILTLLGIIKEPKHRR